MSSPPRPAILASPGTTAVFSDEVSTWSVPVIAWSTESEALVLAGADLIRANQDEQFTHVAFDRNEALLNLVGRHNHPSAGGNGNALRNGPRPIRDGALIG